MSLVEWTIDTIYYIYKSMHNKIILCILFANYHHNKIKRHLIITNNQRNANINYEHVALNNCFIWTDFSCEKLLAFCPLHKRHMNMTHEFFFLFLFYLKPEISMLLSHVRKLYVVYYIKWYQMFARTMKIHVYIKRRQRMSLLYIDKIELHDGSSSNTKWIFSFLFWWYGVCVEISVVVRLDRIIQKAKKKNVKNINK